MTDELSLLDENDSFVKRSIKNSNQRYRLEKQLGSEIIQELEETHTKLTKPSFNYGLVAGSLVGIVFGARRPKEVSPPESRRDFLYRIIPALTIGSLGGFCIGCPILFTIGMTRFEHYVHHDLIPRHVDKKKIILEYVDVKYIPHASI